MATKKEKVNLFAIPEEDAPETNEALLAEVMDFSALEEAEAAVNALSIAPVNPKATPFERNHQGTRVPLASGFNADINLVLEPTLEDRTAKELAQRATNKMKVDAVLTAKEVRGFTPIPVSAGHVAIATILQRTMKPVDIAELVWAMPNMNNARDKELIDAKEALTPLIQHLVAAKVLDSSPGVQGRGATYSLSKRLELEKIAADNLPVSGIILYLNAETLEVMPHPSILEIAEGIAIPEIVLDETDGFVTCTATGTKLPCGMSRWIGTPFITPKAEIIEPLYQDYLEERGEKLEKAEAAGDEERVKALKALREPSYWNVLRAYPDHTVTTLIAYDDRGRLLVQADAGQHMEKAIRKFLKFADGSWMISADGKAFMLALTAAIMGNCSPKVARQLNLTPREDGKDLPTLLQEALVRDTLRGEYILLSDDELGEMLAVEGEEFTTREEAVEILVHIQHPATTGHNDPYSAVWDSFTKSLKRKIGETGVNPRNIVKKGSTPAGYGSGQANVAGILREEFGVDRALGLEIAAEIASFTPLGDALKAMRKAKTPCASFSGSVHFVYEWLDENHDKHSFECETSTVINNDYVGREWRFNEVLVLRTGESNLSKARTSLLANLNQGIEAWLLKCQSAFAAHLGEEIWSTHDQTSTRSEYMTRLITSISATALNAIIEQNRKKWGDVWGIQFPVRTHAPYDINTPFYVFEAEE